MIDPYDLPTDFLRLGAMKSGCYYQCTPAAALTTAATMGIGVFRATPFAVNRRTRLTRIGMEVTVAGDSGSLVRLGIYRSNTQGYPAALVLDAGTIAGDSATVQEITIDLTLDSDLYWVGAAVQNVTTTQPTIRTLQTFTPQVPVALTTGATPSAGLAASLGWSALSVTGALPATFPTSVNLASVAARVFVKAA